MIGHPSSMLCAMSKRSNGSRWCRGNDSSPEHVIQRDGQNFDSVVGQLLHQIRSRGLGQRKFASLHLNQNLPHAGDTQPEIIRTGIDLSSPPRELRLPLRLPTGKCAYRESPSFVEEILDLLGQRIVEIVRHSELPLRRSEHAASFGHPLLVPAWPREFRPWR